MIIEIKGLPEGQIIKHISVDITFDEHGNVDEVHHTTTQKPIQFDGPLDALDATGIDFTPEEIETRKKVDIPAEMMDMEI